MTDYEAFVHELIGYIFKVQDKDDDNLSAEIICRKLYKYGLIEKVNHEWRMKYRPRYVWPARIRKDEPQIFICPIQDNYEALIEDEPQTEREGEWIEGKYDLMCSNCENTQEYEKFPYCPYCGASMRERRASDDKRRCNIRD